jgi:hypothetical protein
VQVLIPGGLRHSSPYWVVENCCLVSSVRTCWPCHFASLLNVVTSSLVKLEEVVWVCVENRRDHNSNGGRFERISLANSSVVTVTSRDSWGRVLRIEWYARSLWPICSMQCVGWKMFIWVRWSRYRRIIAPDHRPIETVKVLIDGCMVLISVAISLEWESPITNKFMLSLGR